MFAEKYIGSVNSSDLRDDEFHQTTNALVAAALADVTGAGAVFGSLLCRVKYADGTVHKMFEAGTGNLAALIRIWSVAVAEKGRSRAWMPTSTAWDMQAAQSLYRRVAEASIAYWLDGRCAPCGGAGSTPDRRICTCCAGTGRAEIEAGRFESDKIRDMVSELEGLYQAHSGRASALLRRVER